VDEHSSFAGDDGAGRIPTIKLQRPRVGGHSRALHQQNLDHNSISGVGIAQKGSYLLGTIGSGSHAINAKRL
jgi:hypothetical protein